MAQPDFQPVSFLTLEAGTSVVDRFGKPVGTVDRVLVFEGGGFDGSIVRTRAGRGSSTRPRYAGCRAGR
jgi:hypothetical protein